MESTTTAAPAPAPLATLGAASIVGSSIKKPPQQQPTETKQNEKKHKEKIKPSNKQKEPEEPLEDQEDEGGEGEGEEDEGEGEGEGEDEEEEEEVDETTPEYHVAQVKRKLLVDKLRHEVHMEMYDKACIQLQNAFKTGSLMGLRVLDLEKAMIIAQQQNEIDNVATVNPTSNHMVKSVWSLVVLVLKRLRKQEKEEYLKKEEYLMAMAEQAGHYPGQHVFAPQQKRSQQQQQQQQQFAKKMVHAAAKQEPSSSSSSSAAAASSAPAVNSFESAGRK